MSELLQALARVSDQLSYLQTDATFQGQGSYSYVSGSKIKQEFRRVFLANGVLFSASAVDAETRAHGEDRGYVSELELSISLSHIETGQRLDYVSIGRGYDKTDKSMSKAWTDAIKSWLVGSFLIATGDAPERDDEGEKLDHDAIKAQFDKTLKELASVEPEKGAAKKELVAVLSHFRTASGRSVEVPEEFSRRSDAVAAHVALDHIRKAWYGQRLEADGASGKAKERKKEAGLG